jgi:hypothetical protein
MAIDHFVSVDRVVREARRLGCIEQSGWDAFLVARYGGLRPAHVRELIDLAGGDVGILDEARRRIKDTTKDSSDLRARQLLRRAAIETLRTVPP